jgi:hypothetical protein
MVLGVHLDLRDVEEFGNFLQEKSDNILCIGLHNLSNLSQDKITSKSLQLIDYIIHKWFDVFLMTEIVLCWRKVGNKNQWYKQILGKC